MTSTAIADLTDDDVFMRRRRSLATAAMTTLIVLLVAAPVQLVTAGMLLTACVVCGAVAPHRGSDLAAGVRRMGLALVAVLGFGAGLIWPSATATVAIVAVGSSLVFYGVATVARLAYANGHTSHDGGTYSPVSGVRVITYTHPGTHAA